MAQDLSGLYISQSFQNLVQRSASGAFNVLATATGTEFIPVSASYAISSSHAVNADTTISSSYAVSSSHARNADIAISASYAAFAQEAENAVRSTKVQIPAIAKETMTKGDPVYISGYNLGQSKPEVSRAEADDAATMPAIGLVLTNAVNNDDIEVITTGDFLNINTQNGLTNPAVGDTVYVDVGGGFTNVKPTGTNLIQNIGVIGRVQQNSGEIVVSCIQRTNDLPNIEENYLWLGDVNSVPQAVISSSIVVDNAVSSSYALTASFATNATPPFPFTGSAEISGSLSVEGDTIVSKNQVGSNATLFIRDDAQNSFNDGPTLQFSGSSVGLIKSQAATNLKINADRDFLIDVGNGGAGAQFSFNLVNNQTGDFNINDQGHRSALYQHENLTETGSIRFANTTLDVGVGIRMDDNKMGLQMYSGSSFVPIIERKVNQREINLYDSVASTGSSGQVLSSNAQGGIEWVVGGGGGSAFPFTGSAGISGSLDVVGDTTVSKNQVGSNATLVIRDDAQSSFTDGPTLQFSGSSVGLIKSQAATNFKINADRDFELAVGNGGTGAQFAINLVNNQSGDFTINDLGHRSARYIHENLTETGSIRFANTTEDTGIAIRMDDNKMALEMYSGSGFIPIIQRESGSREINFYDSTLSTGSSAQVLSSNVNGGVEWVDASGGGGGVTAFSNVVRTSLAGPSLSDTVFTQVEIPGGTFAAGDILQVKALTKQDYTGAGTIYCNLGFSATSGSSGQNYGSWAAGDKQAVIYDKTIQIVTTDGTGDGTVALKFGSNIDAVDNGLETFPDGPNGRSINWNNNVYLYINAFVDNASSFIETRFLNIMKIN